ncbi:MAG: HEAT repeat domain-containing protein [Candidatus Lokiarchaeota archaeon]|nr:HEAT repeat domain-containing protein [Candidatus Lokiarchaeota archaeon]
MDDLIFKKFDEMGPSEAIIELHSLLKSSNSWERNIKCIEKLILFHDNSHFNEIKYIYNKETNSNVKIKLIELLNLFYTLKGKKFLEEHYKKEKDWKVRMEILKSIEINPDDSNIEFIINSLKDSNIDIKKLSISQLGRIGNEKALKYLIELLRYGKNEIKYDIIDSISKIIKNKGINLIYPYIDNENIYIRRSIPLILRKIKNTASIEIIYQLLSNKDDIVKINSLKTIHSLMKKEIPTDVIEKIIELLNYKNLKVKYLAIQILGKLRNKVAIKPLTNLLKTSDLKIRKKVIKALSNLFSDLKMTKSQYQYLEHKNINIRAGYISLMGIINNKESLDHLIKALNSKNSKIRKKAISSIIKISQDQIDNTLLEALKSPHWQIRKAVSKILGNIKNIQENIIIDALIPLMQDKNNRVRIAATNTLARIHNPKIILFAKDKLNDSDWRLRRCSIILLMKIGTKETLNSVISSIHDKDIHIRKWAIRAIGRLGDKENIDLLIDSLKDSDSKIKIIAIKTLGQLGDIKAIKPLAELLTDLDWKIKKESENALNKIDINWIENL